MSAASVTETTGKDQSMSMRVLMIMSCAVLSACTLIRPLQTVSMQSYVLESPATGHPSNEANPRGATLVVAELRSRPGYDTPRMAYVKRDYTLDHYANSQWADTPARMLQPLLVSALETTGHYNAVLRAPAPVAAGLRLDTEIVRFEQVFITQPSHIRITLRVLLTDTYKGQVLGQREFDTDVPSPGDDAYGGVRALNQALTPLLKDITAYCVALTPAAGTP
jgi:cholesterol transport system auxiliary component